MIKREESFCHLATMFTNEEEKTFFFLIYQPRLLRHDQEKKSFSFIQLLKSLRHDQEIEMFFSFSHFVH